MSIEHLKAPQKKAPFYPLTDSGNGERFAWMHHQTARYSPEWKKWLIWDGARWQKDTKNEVFLKAIETARTIPDDIKKCLDADTRKAALKWAVYAESGKGLREMLSSAEKQPGVAVLVSELDNDLWLFNLPNGTLDLRIGKLKPHDPDDLITKIGGCAYDPRAQCPNWYVFLDQAHPTAPEVPLYLQRSVGYSLTGTITEQTINFMLGTGSNGKSVFANTVSALFGDYGHTIEPATLLTRQQEKMATDIADLFRKRFVDCAETEDGKRFNESGIKRLTSYEKLTGEKKYENPFTFTPTHHIFFSTNHAPEIRGTDNGIWRRILQIKWEQKFWDRDKGETGPVHMEANKGLQEELKAELSGILNWAIQGCLDWQEGGLRAPEIIQEATAAYRQGQDVLGSFVTDCCDVDEDYKERAYKKGQNYLEPAKVLYGAYGKWCEETGEYQIKYRGFLGALRERGFVSEEGGANKTTGFFGIRVSD